MYLLFEIEVKFMCKKICPLRKVKCIADECEWWDSVWESCSVSVIAKLQNIMDLYYGCMDSLSYDGGMFSGSNLSMSIDDNDFANCEGLTKNEKYNGQYT